VGDLPAVDFTLDVNQSSVTLSGNVLGVTIQEQAPGSLTTKFGGTLKVAVTDAEIVFTGSSAVAAQNNGSWEPKAGGESGSDPANYGGKADAGFLGQAKAAVRNAQFDITSPPLALTGGTFDSGSLLFQFLGSPAGALDYSVSGLFSQKGSVSLAGVATNRVSTRASLTTGGDLQTLTIPISTVFLLTLVSADDTQLKLEGQLVATRSLAQPGKSFADWLAERFPGTSDPAVIGSGADPDQDGVPNFVEFAFGLNPKVVDLAFAPLRISLDGADPSKRKLEYVRPKGLSGAEYLLQASDDLSANWNLLPDPPTVTEVNGAQEKVVVWDSASIGTAGRRFVRLLVRKP
jgi:hypothetical protein